MPNEQDEQLTFREAYDRQLARIEAVRLEQDQGWWRYGMALLGLTLVAESLIARRRRAAEVVS